VGSARLVTTQYVLLSRWYVAKCGVQRNGTFLTGHGASYDRCVGSTHMRNSACTKNEGFDITAHKISHTLKAALTISVLNLKYFACGAQSKNFTFTKLASQEHDIH